MAIINFNSISGVSTISATSSITVGNNVAIGTDTVTATTFSGNLTGNVTGNINSSGIATFTSGIVVSTGSTSAPSISPSGDSNTGIFFPSADTIAFAEGGVESARFDSGGRLLIGADSARNVGGHDAKLQIEALGYSATIQSVRNANNVDGAYLFLGKSRGTSLGSNTIVQSGDELGNVRFYGADGSTMRGAAEITAVVDGTPGSNDMPGRLIFATTSDGAGSPTERVRIDSSGRVTMPYQPSFFAYLTTTVSAFSPPYSGKVLFSTEEFDVGSCYDAPNSQFVAPVAGKYFFRVEFYLGFEGTGVRVGHSGWYVNGTITHSVNIIGGVTNGGGTQYHPTASSSTILNLSANDSVDFRWTGIAGNFSAGYMYSGKQTNFQGFLIG